MNADPLAVSDDGLEKAVLTVNLDPAVNTGGIIHGAAGFLYGISSADVPATNTVVPLKSKILVTKGALGTERPYGDALGVAKTFLESGGEQIQMYNSNYYGVFGVTATREQYCSDLINYICPAAVGWKEAWKEEHGTPDSPKDTVGARVDINSAIVYVPINEGTPNFDRFIITPAALDEPVGVDTDYPITLRATEGGSIVSNENIVEPGGEYTLTVCPDKEHVLGRILINGADRTAEAVEHDGKYSLTVKGVSDNQTAEAYFAGAAVPKEALAALAGALDIKDRGDYTEDSYNAFAAAKSYAEAVLKKAGAYQCETDSAYKDLFLAVNGLEVAGGGAAVYFVDCGDHDPSTLSSGDSLGTNNSLTDMIYGEDPVTKMMWGAVDPKNSYMPTGGGNRTKSKGAYTAWTWANENSPGEIADGQPKEATFRYARNQDSEGITPRRVEYKFELAPGLYDLKVCVGNYWGNSGNVDIYASGEKINENTVSVPALRHFDFFCS